MFIRYSPQFNIPSTLDPICAINSEEDVLNSSKSSVYKGLKSIGFSLENVEKEVMLKDCDDTTGLRQRDALIHAGSENEFISGAEYHFPCKENSINDADGICAELCI
ncbi:hypothetical protein Trydic_g18963 [Trypoxylus dichotomus]